MKRILLLIALWIIFMVSCHYASAQSKWCEQDPNHPLCICEKQPNHPNCCCTPVIISDFVAVEENETVILYWTIEQEKDNNYFTLYGSNDAKNWVKISDIVGRGTTEEKKVYKYVDYKQSSGRTYYMLQQTDYDGTFKYLGVVMSNNDIVSIKRYDVNGKSYSSELDITRHNGLMISKISTTKGVYIIKSYQR